MAINAIEGILVAQSAGTTVITALGINNTSARFTLTVERVGFWAGAWNIISNPAVLFGMACVALAAIATAVTFGIAAPALKGAGALTVAAVKVAGTTVAIVCAAYGINMAIAGTTGTNIARNLLGDGALYDAWNWVGMRAIQACIVLTLYGIAKLCQWTYQACRARSAAKKEAARLAEENRLIEEAARRAEEAARVQKGTLTGNPNTLTQAERRVVNDLLDQGNNVELIPRTNEPSADFFVNGVRTELKTITGTSPNTPVNRITTGFNHHGADAVILDARGTAMTPEEARIAIVRAQGTFSNNTLPGRVEIWTSQGIITGGN